MGRRVDKGRGDSYTPFAFKPRNPRRVLLGSVVKKRRKKIRKHKQKKLRRKMRHKH